MTGNEIRESFLKYFEGHGHRRVRSSSLIPAGDPTLLFTNAGMVQFKDVFLGSESRDYVRATTSQKCVRAGGKHNDLENVGRTARHHTFFEMLGNFSFGDYFKEEAIPFAWEYLTVTVGLPKELLWATVYTDDDQAAEIWRRKAGVPAERIVRLGEKDNFWAMGDTGPCGPCSEIIIDQGPSVGCGRPDCAVGCDCDRYLELWNLVFMQYERSADGKLTPLPRPSIDTGMGLERLAAVLQGKQSNFESDLFAPIIRFVEEASGVRYGKSEKSDVSIRVIADHLRSTTFLIADGVIPSNEGRGYVLRRIMRRAGRHAWMLGIQKSFLHKGVDVLAGFMGGAYPELVENADYTAGMIRREEERFASTLEAGLPLITEALREAKAGGRTTLPGETLFKLYDTYGFPLDLAEEMAADEGVTLDQAGFDRLMEEQRHRARASWAGSGEEGVKESWRRLMEKLPPVEFTGYDTCVQQATVAGLAVGDAEVADAPTGARVDIVLDRTPFYGESGGQAGDIGELSSADVRVRIGGSRKPGERFIVLQGEVVEGTLRVGQRVRAEVDPERRARTAANHTATHLLQASLRSLLGDHVKQAGSQVTSDRLRFDFTHFKGVTPDELERVEDQVNRAIRRNEQLTKVEMPIEEAQKSGAMAIFGEKYGERVRVVTVPGVSAELCGGTHVRASGDIGSFRIVAEGSVAAGVRRIEAVTGEAAMAESRAEESVLRDLSGLLKVGRDGLVERVRKLQEEVRDLERQVEKSRNASAAGHFDEIVARAGETGGIRTVVARLDGLDSDALRTMVDRLKERLKDVAVVLVSVQEGKLLVVAGAAGGAVGKVHAGKLVGELAALAGGKGGGRPDFAQAGGKEVAAADRILSSAGERLAGMLS
jgi:alanyl-tRNA synthetase